MGGTCVRKLVGVAETPAEALGVFGGVALEIVIGDTVTPMSLCIFGFAFIGRSVCMPVEETRLRSDERCCPTSNHKKPSVSC